MELNRQERIARAEAAFRAHRAVYYENGCYRGADFWDYAELFEIAEDLYEVTGDRSLLPMMEEMIAWVIQNYGEDWSYNPYNDDIMWLVIAMTRAFLMTGNQTALELAVGNYEKTFARASSDDFGGGLFWRIENQSKHTCINGPAAVASDYLAKACGDDRYYDNLRYCLDFMVRILFEPETGKVYDCINLSGQCSKWSYTYNLGTFLGSCLAWYEKTKDPLYRTYAERTLSYTMNSKYQGGIMDDEGEGGDQPGFKGILSRYIRRYASLTGEDAGLLWLRRNADAAWSHRNADGIMSTCFGHQTEEGTEYDVFAASSAVSVLINAVGGTAGFDIARPL